MGTTKKRESAELKLTPKQARFVEEYGVDLNATQAAIRAGYSKSSAKVIASQNLTKLNIQAAIAEAQAARAKRTKVTGDAVVTELALIGFATLGDDDVTTGDKRLALVDLGRHLGLFGKANGNGAHPAPVDVNVYNITQDQVTANIDRVFKRASEEQAKKRALN